MSSFQLTPRNITQQLRTAASAASSKSPLPTMQGVLFEIHPKNGLTLTGGDFENFVSVNVPGINLLGPEQQEIKFIAPRKLIDAINYLPGDQPAVFNFDETKRKVTINYGPGGKGEQVHSVMSAEDYPQVPEIDGQEIFLNSDLKRVSFTVSKDTSRLVFTGVFIDFENKKAVATDTFNMACIDLTVSEEKAESNGGPASIIIQAKAANFISDMENPSIVLDKKAKFVKIVSGDTTMISRLIDGRYPNVPSIIAQIQNPCCVVEFKGAEMREVLGRVASILDKERIPSFSFKPGKGKISISGRSESGTGQIVEDIACVATAASVDLEAFFNHQFVLNMVKAAGSEVVRWELTGSLTPAAIRGVGDDGAGFVGVVVPARG